MPVDLPGAWMRFVMAVVSLDFLVLMLGLPLLILLLEKRYAWRYQPEAEPTYLWQSHGRDSANPYESPQAVELAGPLPLGDYLIREIRAAEASGFLQLGVYRDRAERLYRVRYSFLLSPDREVIALICQGRILGGAVRATWLITCTVDGRCIVTSCMSNADEPDLSGLSDEWFVARVGFHSLLERHQQHRAALLVPSMPYPEDNPLDGLRAHRIRSLERMENRRYLRFLDAQRTMWRYTWKGAILMVFRTNVKVLAFLFKSLRVHLWPRAAA